MTKIEHAAQTLSGQILQLQDDEKRRISRELHDVTGQKLAALNLDLSQLGKIAAIKSDPAAKKILDESIDLTKQVAKEIRNLSSLLYPPLLGEMGLVFAVRWYLDEFEKETGIHVGMSVAADFARLPLDMEVSLFRIVQESLKNVHSFSACKGAEIRLEVIDDHIQLQIEDQGKSSSFKIPKSGKVARNSDIGIQSMRERVGLFSGRLDIAVSTQGGMIVTAILPLQTPSE